MEIPKRKGAMSSDAAGDCLQLSPAENPLPPLSPRAGLSLCRRPIPELESGSAHRRPAASVFGRQMVKGSRDGVFQMRENESTFFPT
jgi:hypothetical protein